jgi:NodT family efflux transporter outer membrane factor (OMF) lipoprotein
MNRILLMMMVGFVMGLNACTVGPNYTKPPVETPPGYKEIKGWKVAKPGDEGIRPNWWETFNDPKLNALEERVNISNQNVVQAEAQFRQARALVQQARAGYFPTISATTSYTRSRGSSTLTPGPVVSGSAFSTYQLPLDLSWELDVWGRVRRLVEANTAEAQASAADLQSILLSSQAALAGDYFLLRALDKQRELLKETTEAYQKTLDLTRNRYASGVVSRADVLQAETQLKSAQAQMIDLGVQRGQLEHAIATLAGKPASVFTIPVELYHLTPPFIPVGLPSELLERRPDIAGAERLMATANAQIGVAKAAFFPTVTLSGSAGLESAHLSDWLSWPSRFWSIGAALAEVVSEGGLRRAQTAQALAAYDATVASYRQTVLTGFQEVEDNLVALRLLEEEARVQEEAVKSARQSVDLALNQYKAGTISYLNVLVTQTTLLGNEIVALGILDRRLTASVLLIKALGGGWDITSLPKAGTMQ